MMIAALVSTDCATAQGTLPPKPLAIVEDSVSLVTPAGRVFGTLELPAHSFPVPVALIIAGSGPTDRNGNSIALPGSNNSLKLLAAGLAERGIASLRYDKRGIAASRAAMTKEEDIRFEDFIADAKGWIAQLRSDPRFSTITIVGHSEGSLIGIVAAREANADGFVSLEGAGRNAKDVIIAQLSAQLPPAVVDRAKDIMEKIESGQQVDSIPPFLAPLFRPSVRPYLVSWFRYTPSTEMAKLTIPALVVQGTTDIQTSEEDARLLAAALPSARLVMIEGMNHVLKTAPPGRAEQMAAYSDPSLPVVPELLEEIRSFIKSVKKH
jgi:pimeloyl-ACP methyl ester carboxylesterase